ncbi:MAG: iron uptake system protein EfeO [Ilumatobacteraceae bacterium]
MRTRRTVAAVTLAALLAVTAGCGDDDGADVRDLGDGTGASASGSGSGSGSGSASASGSGSGSATGIAAGSVAQSTDNPLITEAVDGYRAYVDEQVAIMLAATTVFTDAVRAGDIEAAKAAFPVSRRSWERIEPIAGLIENIDTAVDAREDDYDGPTDDEFTGWHRLEYQLWDAADISESGPIADQLDADLQSLADQLPSLELPPGVLTVGAQELIEEVASPDGKLSGEEDRYSGTDLYDFLANVEGSEALVDLLAPALEEADPELLATIREQFAALYEHLAELGSFEDGFVAYSEVTQEQKDELAADLGALAESLSLLNGTLGLE